MKLKRIILATGAIAILAAIPASNANAETVSHWSINASQLTAGQSANTKCSVHEEAGGSNRITFLGYVGEPPFVTYTDLEATGIECFNAEGLPEGNGSAQIQEVGTAAKGFARLKFTGVTVATPSHCVVAGKSITTGPLESEVLFDHANPSIVFNKYSPPSSSVVGQVRITSDGVGSCAVGGTRIVRGSICEKFTNSRGAEYYNQSAIFSEEAPNCGLTFASNPVSLTGTVNNELAGTSAGKKWGVW